jgi:glutaconate CoA-transferase subunit B
MDGRECPGVRSCVSDYTSEEMMTIAAAREFKRRKICFVGVGLPSVAACLARQAYDPGIVLMYESGVIGAKPTAPPLSIADPELAETAVSVVSVPEIFSYWLQGGRVDVGFLGAAQIDRFGNLNSTVIGDYQSPKLRLPGAGGAPQIAAHAREIVVIVRQTLKTFVSQLDFLTSARSKNRTTVVTDLGILQSDGESRELLLVSRYPGVDIKQVLDATGWPLRSSDSLVETAPPSLQELALLRELNEKTQRH